MLFDKIRKTRQPEAQEVEKIFDRLQTMRSQVGHRDVPVADLFGLAGREETRARWPLPAEPKHEREPERVRPQDVPAVKNYVAWE
jgi:hypothetical protein